MPTARHLTIIAYDQPDSRDRRRLAALLELHMIRVQDSVFEGWFTREEADHLAGLAHQIVGDSGSLRMYRVPRGAVPACRSWGFPPPPDQDGLLIV